MHPPRPRPRPTAGRSKAIDAIVQRFGKGAIMALGGDPGDRPNTRSSPPARSTSTRRSASAACRAGASSRSTGPSPPARRPSCCTPSPRPSAPASCAPSSTPSTPSTSSTRPLGVKLEDLLISQPDCGEQALDIVDTLARTGGVGLIVVDSVAALIPRAELEGDMGDQHLGLQARLMSQAMRKVSGVAHQTGTIVVFINQLRQKIGVTFGSPRRPPAATRSSTSPACASTSAGSPP
jgi:recombination protein RecA